ncbi:hypothetical protein YQE_12828, partial [Dendroctonus ponderosae]
MPMWCPPTPPQQDDDVYIDQTMAFLYEDTVMSETQLPPIYVKKEFKRRLDPSYNVDYRRPIKVPRRDESVVSPPKSLFHSSTLLKLRRDIKLQKYRSLRPPSVVIPCKTSTKPVDPAVIHSWTIHEDMALLKVIKILQGLPTNLIVTYAAQTPNWDFAADYVNSVALVYRSPKQCKQRPSPRTSQLYTQDNNSTFCQMVADSFTALKSLAIKRLPTTRTVVNNPLMNKTKNTPVLNECGIDLEHPLLPFEIAAKRAERIAKEKKALTPEQLAKLQMLKAVSQQQQAQGAVSSSGSATSQSASGITTVVTVPTTHVIVTSQAPIVVTTSATIVTPSPAGRPQRIIASPLQTSTVVSVSGLSPAQLQAATQRLIVTGGAAKAVTSATGAQGKQFSPAQLQMIRQAASLKNNQFRLHANSLAQASKASTVTIAGQQAVVQFSQAQPRGQFVRQGTVTVGGKTGVSRTVTDSEVAQLLKKQQQLQQQKMTSGTISQTSNASGGNTIHGLTTQVFAQAIQQAGTPGAQVATLVKAVPSSGATQTVTIPVSGVTLAASGAKAIAPSLKPTTAQQLRHMQIQQQLMAQKKLAAAAAASGQKLSITTSGSKGSGVQTTQLIVGAKQAMTVQQFQQVIRTPINVGQGPVVLTKGSTSRVIPVNAGQGTKQTIQVVAASSQALSSALRPQGSTTIAGIKLQSAGNSSQQALLSQVTAALNQNAVRQNSPVRLQTASGQPIVAATGQSSTLNAQSQSHNVEQQE